MTRTTDDEWIVFTGKSTTQRDKIAVSIHTKGTFALSQGAMNALGNPTAIELLWNPGKHRIGFKAAGPEVPHAYRARRQNKGTSYQVSGKAFMLEHGITFDQVQRYPARLIGDVLVIDLEPAEVSDPQANGHQTNAAGANP